MALPEGQKGSGGLSSGPGEDGTPSRGAVSGWEDLLEGQGIP